MMDRACLECGKEIKEETDSPYCNRCDEILDKKFEIIEDNILIYKEVIPDEIEVLKKFEKEDIIEMYIRVYESFTGEGDLTAEQVSILNQITREFNITENEVGKDKIVELKEGIPPAFTVKDTCTDCSKKIQDDFNFCPYCGYKIKL